MSGRSKLPWHGLTPAWILLTLPVLAAVASAKSAPKSEVMPNAGTNFSQYDAVKLWDAATGGQVRPFNGHIGWVEPGAFSTDSARVLSGSVRFAPDNTLTPRDTATRNLIGTFAGRLDRVSSVAPSPDGVRVLSNSIDAPMKLCRRTASDGPRRALVQPPDERRAQAWRCA
jgi:WD40 repeat protein